MFLHALATATDTTDNLTLNEVFTAWFGWIVLAAALYAVIGLVSALLIARKAGYSHWLGVIAVAVPIVGAIFVLLFAFVKWPALRERDKALALLEEKGLSIDPPKPPAASAAKPVSPSSKEPKKPAAS